MKPVVGTTQNHQTLWELSVGMRSTSIQKDTTLKAAMTTSHGK